MVSTRSQSAKKARTTMRRRPVEEASAPVTVSETNSKDNSNVADSTNWDDAVAQFICGPVLRFIPESVTPNSITFLNHIVNWCLLALALYSHELETTHRITALLVCSVLNFITMMLDSLDGMQARKTKQTSRLGEVLDHWMDAIHVPLICGAILYVLEVPMWANVGMHIANAMLYNAQLIVYHYTGVFVTTSGVEAQIAASGVYVLAAVLVNFPSPAESDAMLLVVSVVGAIGIFTSVTVAYKDFVSKFDATMWRHYLLMLSFNACVAFLYCTGRMGRVAFLLVVSFLSWRITGCYVMLSVRKITYKGYDWAVVAWFVVLYASHYYLDAPTPLSEVFTDKVLSPLPSLLANASVQDVLPYLMCLHLGQRSVAMLGEHWTPLKEM